MRDESGFTLVELLVVLLVALVVLGAALYIVEVGMRATGRTQDRIETTQRGRQAMQTLTRELNSSCVGPGVTPILAGSDGTHINVISQYGSGTVITPNEHVITFNAAAKTLTDVTYAATGGAAPSWTFSTTASASRVLLEQVAQQVSGQTTLPVFQYFAYSGNQLSTTALATPLTATTAATVAQVSITYLVSPLSRFTEATRSTPFTDSVVLRTTAPPDTVGSTPVGPCA